MRSDVSSRRRYICTWIHTESTIVDCILKDHPQHAKSIFNGLRTVTIFLKVGYPLKDITAGNVPRFSCFPRPGPLESAMRFAGWLGLIP